ncbi:VOC family protein [Aliagarivorans marinus]|uniref:VOC family protein n=1 Tax=Aliagarivorans marinus TaxID=561965 RepID=UPI00041FA2CA|nr:VOC family protein [Aliagarivorans marinus]
MRIAAHRLLIRDPELTLDFYQKQLGMRLVTHQQVQQRNHYLLALGEGQACLELVYDPSAKFTVAAQPNSSEGYWKFSIAVDDLEDTRNRLVGMGGNSPPPEKGLQPDNSLQLGQCFEVPNLAYLCHLVDPNGYSIELVQKTLKPSPQPEPQSGNTFNLSTLRIKDIDKSLAFYRAMGMELVYRYRSDSRKMTLLFLIARADLAEFEGRCGTALEERLWQSPYTVLELQHLDGSELNEAFGYRVGPMTGFLGLDMLASSAQFAALSQQVRFGDRGDYIEIVDPDGYELRVRNAALACENLQ